MTAAWCGPCLWHLANDRRVLADARFADRLLLADLLVADEDNMPATLAFAERFRGRIDAPPDSRLGVDPQHTFRTALLSRKPLPVYFLVDTRTMTLLSTLSDPDPVALRNKLALELALLDGAARPVPDAVQRFDEIFTENQWDLIKAMRLDVTAPPPPDPSNAYGDDATAAALGKKLFVDEALTPSGTVSCATCHDPARDFTDGAAQSTGIVRIDRNAPALALSAHAKWQFWDGRADSLWAQALAPFEDPREMASSRTFVAQQIRSRYESEYDAVFGAKYPLASEADDTRIFVNVGKAIAAFERSLRVTSNPLDAYAAGDLSALTSLQKDALHRFFDVGCAQCHWGPRLTDDSFHVLRFPTGRQDRAADRGRDGILAVPTAPEFAASSKWSDGTRPGYDPLWWERRSDNMLGAFKTPALRGVPTSAPYGHGGMHRTLLDVTRHYGQRGLPHDDPHAIGTTEQWVPNFDGNVQAALPAFLDVLTAGVVP